MLWNASKIEGFAVEATDGQLGTVADLLFDADTWVVNYVAVDTGGGQAMVPVTAIGKLEASSRLPIKLTRQQASGDAKPDTKLRSLAAMRSYDINATDGGIGHALDFLVRDTDWQILFITADAQTWQPGEKVMISRHAITAVDWETRLITLDVDRQAVKDSPPYDASISVDGAHDEKVLTYFGIKFVNTKTAQA